MAKGQLCRFDNEVLMEKYDEEPFTMNTPIGSRLRRWVAYRYCPRCGLMYTPLIEVLDDYGRNEAAPHSPTEGETR